MDVVTHVWTRGDELKSVNERGFKLPHLNTMGLNKIWLHIIKSYFKQFPSAHRFWLLLTVAAGGGEWRRIPANKGTGNYAVDAEVGGSYTPRSVIMQPNLLFVGSLQQDRGAEPCNPPRQSVGWSYQLFGCCGVKERRFVGQHMFPPVVLSNPCGWTPPLCLISPVNNCSGFSSHHWYSNQCLLWAKQRRGPRGQLLGVFQCVYMQRPARKRLSALLKTLRWADAHI